MRVIYVDDEPAVLDNFRMTVEGLSQIDSLNLFGKSEDAIGWVQNNPIDVAFLDVEMPIINGIELAKRLKQIDCNIRIVFVTAYQQYALQAFGVDAIGYLLKPYSREEVEKELEKASFIRPRPDKKIEIRTMPDFMVFVEGRPLQLGRTKQEELLALLVDKGDVGITVGEAVTYLWPDKVYDEGLQGLYRVTMHRLMDALKEARIDYIIGTEGKRKFIRTDMVECDLYKMLEGNSEAIRKYSGTYLRGFAWTEERNAQLGRIKDTMSI